MNTLKKQIEDLGIEVRVMDKRFVWVNAQNRSIKIDTYELFGLEKDDLKVILKNKFYQYNIKIDLLVPENNKSTKNPKPLYNMEEQLIKDKKENIRQLLKNKFKLI